MKRWKNLPGPGRLWFGGSLSLAVGALAWAGASIFMEKPLQRAALTQPLPPAWDFRAYHADANSLLTGWQDTAHFNGTVLFARAGRILHTGAYGHADAAHREPLTTQSVFQLASVSKMFTATAIILLSEDGLLDLDRPVQAYLDAFPYPEITIRHLLNHRSGLPRYEHLLEKRKEGLVSASNAAILGALAEEQPPLGFSPGSRFQYGNINYALLGLIVEQVSGLAFAEYVQQRIFGPLHMRHTSFFNRNWPLSPGMAVGHKHRRAGYYPVPGDFLDGVCGDKGIHSTVEDLFRFDQALYAGKVFSPEVQAWLFHPAAAPDEQEPYHYGWRLIPGRQGFMYHFGWWMGFRTCFIRDMAQKTTFIALSNRDRLSKPIDYWLLYDQLSQLLPSSDGALATAAPHWP